MTKQNILFQEESNENLFLECDLETNLMDTFYSVLWFRSWSGNLDNKIKTYAKAKLKKKLHIGLTIA